MKSQQVSTQKVSKEASIQNLKQIISQFEQDLKDSIDDEKKRKEIARHLRNTRMILDLVTGRAAAKNHQYTPTNN